MVYKHKLLTTVFCLCVFLIFNQSLTAQTLNIDYYGVVSQSQDLSMLKMAQDMFFTQLKGIDRITVDDKRSDNTRIMDTPPQITQLEENHIAFFTEIRELKDTATDNIEWECILYAYTKDNEIPVKKTNMYESYYKILTNTKSSLEDFFSQMKGKTASIPGSLKAVTSGANTLFNIESLAGTWEGEEYSDKIIILRGGRGFIVLKNGATMNIRITSAKNDANGNTSEIQVKQIGAVNASFFPNLPRSLALEYAATSKPIEWSFHMTQNGTLQGKKNTLIQTASESEPVIEGFIDTTWIKK